MLLIGLTGGIGSGKSTVANIFSDLGVPVYNSDQWAKKLMQDSQPLQQAIVALLGPQAYSDGKLDRAYIAQAVFGDVERLNALNELVHPAVRAHFKEWAAFQNSPYVIQEAAIIFEAGNAAAYDCILLVTAPEKIRMARVLERDKTTEAAVRSRMAQQWSDAKKREGATWVIENIDLEATRQSVHNIHNQILKLSSSEE